MSIRKIMIAGLLVVVVGTLIYWSLRRMESPSTVDVKPKVSKPVSLTQAEETMLRTWRGNSEKAKVVRAICLKHSLSKKQILDLIGIPQYPEVGGNNSIGYSFVPSQVLSFYFDEEDKVFHIDFPGIEFASHYDRVWAFIRLGMTKEEVNTRLGYNQKELDDGKKWQFHAQRNDPYFYNIYFDENDKVIKLEKIELEAKSPDGEHN